MTDDTTGIIPRLNQAAQEYGDFAESHGSAIAGHTAALLKEAATEIALLRIANNRLGERVVELGG